MLFGIAVTSNSLDTIHPMHILDRRIFDEIISHRRARALAIRDWWQAAAMYYR
jgi:hypothetical protein